MPSYPEATNYEEGETLEENLGEKLEEKLGEKFIEEMSEEMYGKNKPIIYMKKFCPSLTNHENVVPLKTLGQRRPSLDVNFGAYSPQSA